MYISGKARAWRFFERLCGISKALILKCTPYNDLYMLNVLRTGTYSQSQRPFSRFENMCLFGVHF